MAQTLEHQAGQLDHSGHLVEHSCFHIFSFIQNHTNWYEMNSEMINLLKKEKRTYPGPPNGPGKGLEGKKRGSFGPVVSR
jgi:hypothetical protein